MKLYPKLLLTVIPAALLASAALIVFSRKAVHAGLIASIEKMGLANSKPWPAELTPGLLARSEPLLLPVLQSCQRDTAALYVVALDTSGLVLAHTNVAEVGGTYADELTRRDLGSSTPLTRELPTKDGPVLDLSIPIVGAAAQDEKESFLFSGGASAGVGAERRIGTLRVGLPLAEALATERGISGRIFWAVVAFIGLTLVVLLLLIRGLLEPIRQLLGGAERIRRGEYGGTVPAEAGDELGDLARGFNAMSQVLAKTTVSKEFFNDILDSTQDQLLVTDRSGRVTLANPALLALLGYEKEELNGMDAALLFDEAATAFSPASLESLGQRGSSRSVSAHFLSKAQAKIPILLSTSVLKSDDGLVTGFIGVAKDMSDVLKLEARMHQSEKLSAVGQLAAGVAHEINNPLGVILGFSQGMARRLTAGDPLELPVRSIEREALRCKKLVQDLLTFSRTSSSDLIALSLNQPIEQTLALIEAQAKLSRVEIKMSLAPGLPRVLANKNQMEQVILNLAKNAIDAMPDGGLLTISTERLECAPHSWICLKVADSGTGIAPEVVSKMFEPFFTTKPVGQGTGLGLSLVNEIVRKHSGVVDVESRPGLTVFTVKLPARTGGDGEKAR